MDWPKDLRSKSVKDIVEIERKSKPSVSCVVQPKEPVIDSTRFSKYRRLLTALAWVRRFIHNSRVKHERIFNILTGIDIQEAEHWLIAQIQENIFRKNCHRQHATFLCRRASWLI